MLLLAQHSGNSQFPFWARVAIGVLVLLFGAWNFAIAMGFMKKPGFRWNGGKAPSSKGPPVTRLGHAGWGLIALIGSFVLFGIIGPNAIIPWFFSAFGLLLVTAFVDLFIDWRKKRREQQES